MTKEENLKIVHDDDEPEAGEFFITGFVDSKPVELFLDTGATFTSVVGQSFLQNYPVEKKMEFQGIGGVSQSGEVICVKGISIGNKSLENQSVVRVQEGFGRKSTVGIDLFKDQAFFFDSKNRSLRFDVHSRAKSMDLHPLSIGKKGHIYLPAQVGLNGMTVESIWDTGAGLTLVDISVVNDNLSNFEFVKKSSGDDTTGTSMILSFYKMKYLKVGSNEYRDLLVLAADLAGVRNAIGEDVRMAFGFNAIVQHNWYFDLKNRKWHSE